MEGAHGAFCVTNFWEHFSPEKEVAQAHAMAQAARDAGVRHVVWSTLEDTREFVRRGSGRMPVLMGRYNVPHYDGKGEANAAFIDRGVPTTLLYTSFYWDNLVHFGMQPQRGTDGVLGFVLPMGDAKLPGIAAADIGPCAFGIFARGDELVGKSIGIAGEHLSGAQMARAARAGARRAGAARRTDAVAVRGARIPGRRRPRQHVPVQERVRAHVLRLAQRRLHARTASGRAELRAVARGQRASDPDRRARGRLANS